MAKRKRRKPKTTNTKNRGAFRVTARNKPEVVDYHLVSSDGKNWKRRPGRIMAMIQGAKPEDLDDTIVEIIKPAKAFAIDSENKKLIQKLTDCSHKLHAVRYHLNTIVTEIDERVSEFEKNYQANAGIAIELENPRLIFETEAFLFQVKSSIDLLAQALGCVVPPINSVQTFRKKRVDGKEHAGGTVIDALRKNGFEELGNVFEEHRANWIQELVTMRDTITHYSRLRDFHCFIEEPFKGETEVTIHYPTMPSGVRVDKYCQSSYENLLNLFATALKYVSQDMRPNPSCSRPCYAWRVRGAKS
jgi:hypothetical protein